jgi:glutaminyl-tRNA synthetase
VLHGYYEDAVGNDFIRKQIAADLASGRHWGRVVTRFPPEPNGYLHIGHASHLYLNHGIAVEFDGSFHLRFDDSNPEGESEEFVRAIQEDIRWLGVDWGDHLYFASDYFERMYDCAEVLIRRGKAYVDSGTGEELRRSRGTPTEPGTAGPDRERSVEENLELLRRMRAGEFEDGSHVLRAKIDLGHPNLLMRDPVLYRIRHHSHYRRGDDWCIYPLYDFAHPLEDAFEGITHSLCTLEFGNNRELYDWVLDTAGFEEPRPHQYEWCGLDLENAILSKRFVKPLVEAGVVSGWDDPRLSTIAAVRRRGIPAEALRLLADIVGVSKSPSRTEEGKLAHAIREVLNPVAPRVMAVIDPLRIVLTTYPADASEEIDVPYFPPDVPGEGSRPVPFSRELYIERSDFAEDPPEGFRRLVEGGEVRLKYAYIIRCDEVIRNGHGEIVELRCSHDPGSRGGGKTADGRRVKGTIHWVSARHALDAEMRLFGPLFRDASADGSGDSNPDGDPSPPIAPEEESAESLSRLVDRINPESIRIRAAKVEPSVLLDDPDTRYQFERIGYFWRDPVDGGGDALVFNRIVEIKQTYRRETEQNRLSGQRPDEGDKAPERAPSAAGDPESRPGSTDGSSTTGEAWSAAREDDPVLAARFNRYRGELGLSPELARVLTGAHAPGDFFEAALQVHEDAPGIASWIANDLRGLLGDRAMQDLPFDGGALGRLAALVADGRVSRTAAKDVLAHMAENGGEPARLIEELGLGRVTDEDTLGRIVDEVLRAWPDKVEQYRSGKTGLMGLFMGSVMSASKGADPQAVRALLTARLNA